MPAVLHLMAWLAAATTVAVNGLLCLNAVRPAHGPAQHLLHTTHGAQVSAVCLGMTGIARLLGNTPLPFLTVGYIGLFVSLGLLLHARRRLNRTRPPKRKT